MPKEQPQKDHSQLQRVTLRCKARYLATLDKAKIDIPSNNRIRVAIILAVLSLNRIWNKIMKTSSMSRMQKKKTCTERRLIIKESIKWMRSKRSLKMINRARDKKNFSRTKTFMTLGRNKVNSNRFNQTTHRIMVPWAMDQLTDEKRRKKTLDLSSQKNTTVKPQQTQRLWIRLQVTMVRYSVFTQAERRK